MTDARDPCVVETGPLSDMLRGFVSRWNRERPAAVGRQFVSRERERDVRPVDALAWLAAETRLPRTTVTSIYRGRSRHTELRKADALTAAIGCPEAFHDGTLEILENPRASKDPGGRCCGGGLTGSGSPGAASS